jgi:uncharacterized protein (TIGR00297 family)
MPTTDLFIYAVLLTGGIWSFTKNKLTLAGSITGAFIGFIIYKGTGITGIVMLTSFFMIASWATGWQAHQKENIGAAEKHSGPRTAAQVLANGGTAALISGITWVMPQYASMLQVMVAGSIAAATADTLSSELGTIYGRRFYNIITLKKDTRGLDGVVSLEGTLIGLAGAALIAAIYALSFGWSIAFVWIILAGFTGNLVDSLLGALLERKGLIGNNTVNFLNTVTGAVVCWLLMQQLNILSS